MQHRIAGRWGPALVAGVIALGLLAGLTVAGTAVAATATAHAMTTGSGQPPSAMRAAGSGYQLAASDGGVFAFGSARFHGSMAGRRLVAPVVGMAIPRGDAGWGVAVPGATRCNPLGGQQCMLPFPSNYYTVPDASMPTGNRVDFPLDAMPANVSGAHIDPRSWLGNDGFSPGSVILVSVPNLDPAASGIPDSGDIAASLQPNAPIVLLDATTMTRLAYWAEPDIRDPNPASRLLLIHPAANLPEGQRIIVALRNLVTTAGTSPQSPPGFAAIMAGQVLPGLSGSAVTAHVEGLLRTLGQDGVTTNGLYLAWDFTVISEQNLTGRLVAMRDQAFASLGTGTPSFRVTTVKNFTTAQNADISRQVIGTFEVPSFLNEPGGPMGSTLNLGAGGLPKQIPGNIQTAVFACLIPRSVDPDPGAGGQPVLPGRPVLYGKGLFSVATEMDISGVLASANAYHLVQCSTNSLGLDGNDVIYDAGIIQNLSSFATVPDRLQQAVLDNLFLERLMTSPVGLASNPSFRADGGSGPSLINTSDQLTYYGNSEGSLMGGVITALSTQIQRAVLGVPSMNYSILLPRSVDFAPFFTIMDKAYPSPSQQQLCFGLMQMLWDRGETDGYVEQLTTSPLPGTPPHQVLLQMAYGDHQVANVTTEIEARTIGAVMHTPVLPSSPPGLVSGNPFYGIPSVPSYPYSGPATLFLWYDTNVSPPPTGDVPPTTGPDPHDFVPRSVPAAQQQLVEFLRTGQVDNVCGSGPCVTSIPLS